MSEYAEPILPFYDANLQSQSETYFQFIPTVGLCLTNIESLTYSYYSISNLRFFIRTDHIIAHRGIKFKTSLQQLRGHCVSSWPWLELGFILWLTGRDRLFHCRCRGHLYRLLVNWFADFGGKSKIKWDTGCHICTSCRESVAHGLTGKDGRICTQFLPQGLHVLAHFQVQNLSIVLRRL